LKKVKENETIQKKSGYERDKSVTREERDERERRGKEKRNTETQTQTHSDDSQEQPQSVPVGLFKKNKNHRS